MALLSAEMILGDYCQSRVGYQPLAAKLLQQNLPPPCLGGVELPWRHKFPVGEMREPLFSSLDADELLDITPPRRQVLVAKRPIDANSLACICLEVEIAPAIARLPRPHVLDVVDRWIDRASCFQYDCL